MNSSTKLITLSSVLTGWDKKFYRVKITQHVTEESSNRIIYIIENESGDILDFGSSDIPLEHKITKWDCSIIFERFQKEHKEKMPQLIHRRRNK